MRFRFVNICLLEGVGRKEGDKQNEVAIDELGVTWGAVNLEEEGGGMRRGEGGGRGEERGSGQSVAQS